MGRFFQLITILVLCYCGGLENDVCDRHSDCPDESFCVLVYLNDEKTKSEGNCFPFENESDSSPFYKSKTCKTDKDCSSCKHSKMIDYGCQMKNGKPFFCNIFENGELQNPVKNRGIIDDTMCHE